ncbi:MAG: hypothetical protein ACPHER_00810 [Nevskiales bacterium]
MLNNKCSYLLFAMLVLGSTAAQAETPMAIGVNVGTAGFGADINMGLTENLNLRLGINHFSTSQDADADDNDGVPNNELHYSGDLRLNNLSLIADWAPWGGVFHVSAGAVANANDLKVDATCNAAICEVGNSSFTSGALGTITTDIDVEDFGPYIGIGWGNPLGDNTGLSWRFELGAIYQGEPSVEMTSSGNCGIASSACQAALDREADELESDLSSLQWYPVAQLGLSYRFR